MRAPPPPIPPPAAAVMAAAIVPPDEETIRQGMLSLIYQAPFDVKILERPEAQSLQVKNVRVLFRTVLHTGLKWT